MQLLFQDLYDLSGYCAVIVIFGFGHSFIGRPSTCNIENENDR